MKATEYLSTLRLIVSAAALGACADQPTNPARPRVDAPVAAISFADAADYPSEAEFRAVARTFPGFAGYHYDYQKGELVVQMDAAGRDLRMLDYVRSLLGNQVLDGVRNYRFANVPVTYRIVKYRFSDLQRWRSILTSHLSKAQGLVTFGVALNPSGNHVFIGLPNVALEQSLRGAATAAGVPSDAFQVSGFEFARNSAMIRGSFGCTALALRPQRFADDAQ